MAYQMSSNYSYRRRWFSLLWLSLVVVTMDSALAGLDTICTEGGPGCTTKLIFDALTRMQGESEFDSKVWSRIRSCMARTNPNGNVSLLEISDTAYTGALQYAISNSPTGATPDFDPWVERISTFQENNVTPLVPPDDTSIPGGSNFLVNGPCNTISNFAYYRGMLAICENSFGINPETLPWLITTAAHQGFGSNLYHAALNALGFYMDTQPVDNMAYIGHQNLVRSLPYSTITHELSEVPRSFSGIEAAQEFDRIIVELNPVPDWPLEVETLKSLIPPYFTSYAAALSTILLMVLPDPIAKPIINILTRLIIEPDQVAFNGDVFVPAIQQALADANVRLRFRAKSALLRKTVGVLIKLLYAAYWNEIAIPGPHITGVISNQVGGLLIPAVNAFANALTRYDRSSDRGVQWALNVYPSEERCRKGVEFSHAKWHEMTANAFVDFLILAEDVNDAIVGRRIFNLADSDLLTCFTANDCFEEFDLAESSDVGTTDNVQAAEATIIEECIPSDPINDMPYTREGVQDMMECLALGGPSTRRKLSDSQQQDVLSCISILMDPESTLVDESLEEQCHHLSLTNTTYQNFGFATGLPKLASCAAQSCRFSYVGMLASFSGMPGCVQPCKETGNNALQCLIHCYAGFNFGSN